LRANLIYKILSWTVFSILFEINIIKTYNT
jgi:hypothetical protein